MIIVTTAQEQRHLAHSVDGMQKHWPDFLNFFTAFSWVCGAWDWCAVALAGGWSGLEFQWVAACQERITIAECCFVLYYF
jgi:hypothetical protein